MLNQATMQSQLLRRSVEYLKNVAPIRVNLGRLSMKNSPNIFERMNIGKSSVRQFRTSTRLCLHQKEKDFLTSNSPIIYLFYRQGPSDDSLWRKFKSIFFLSDPGTNTKYGRKKIP